jgi:hypothetical protein
VSEIWIVMLICIGAAPGQPSICADQVYAEPVETVLLCMLGAGDISRIYEGSRNPRCVVGSKPNLPDISFAAAERWG